MDETAPHTEKEAGETKKAGEEEGSSTHERESGSEACAAGIYADKKSEAV
jgi:hypothetical protein